MIILTKDKGVVIPNYDDLENKPKINGVTLEGDLTTEDLGIEVDTTAIDASLNALDASIEQNYRYITNLNQAISDLDTMIDNNSNQIGTLSNDLESLDSEVTGLDNDFKDFTEYVDSSVKIPTMFIPDAYSGSVDLEILLPIYNAVINDKPWIVWGYLGANGNYNMVECSTIGNNSITFYDNSVASDNSLNVIRWWTFNIIDGSFVMEERDYQVATKSYVDEQIGDINTILENIIG